MSTQPIDAPLRLGRPRDERADSAILDATLELIADVGVSELRMSRVARRAGVGKATIYRRYASKDELVARALAMVVGEIEVPDSGSTRDDLFSLMRSATELYSRPRSAGLMAAVIDATHRDPQLAASVRRGFLTVRRKALGAVLDRGVERGDLRSDLDRGFALDVLAGPLFYRLLVTGGAIDEELACATVELIMRGFAPDRPHTGEGGR